MCYLNLCIFRQWKKSCAEFFESGGISEAKEYAHSCSLVEEIQIWRYICFDFLLQLVWIPLEKHLWLCSTSNNLTNVECLSIFLHFIIHIKQLPVAHCSTSTLANSKENQWVKKVSAIWKSWGMQYFTLHFLVYKFCLFLRLVTF